MHTDPLVLHKTVYRPFIPVAAAIAAGIACGAWLPGYIRAALCSAAFLALFLGIMIFRKESAAVCPLLFCLISGYLSIQPWLGIALPDHHVSRFSDGGPWTISGVVATGPVYRQIRWQFVLSTHRLEKAGQAHTVCGLVQVSGRGDPVTVVAGDSVSLVGRIRSIRNFANPGGFDYERHMALKAIHARVYARAGSLRCRTRAPSSGGEDAVGRVRQFLAGKMADALCGFSDDTVNLFRLILLGDRSGLSPELRRDFNRAGLGHVLAISGLHVGMVAAFVFFTSRWLLAWVPALLKHAWTSKGASLVALWAVIGYGVLAGLSPSTQRAMVMAGVFLVRFWIGRRYDWLNALATAALVIMAVYPPALLGISFQLSFAAVLALIAGSLVAPIVFSDKNHSLPRRICGRIAAFIWISLLAILGTLPLVAYYFNQICLVGLAANLVAVPLVGAVVLPMGLAGLLGIGIGVPGMSAWCWRAGALAMEIVRVLAQCLSSWPWSAVQIVTPTVLEIGLYFLLGAVLLFWRRLPWRVPLLAAVLSLWLLDGAYWGYQRFGRTDFRVTVLDVGQGSANLLQFPGGYTALVDGGGFSDNRSFDVGQNIVAPLLWRNKIKTVDLVVLSHANSDHLNGLLYILEHFTVREVWDNGQIVPTAGCRQWHRLIAEKGIYHPDFRQIARHQVRAGVRLDILSPPTDFLARRAVEPWRDENENSLVLKARYGSAAILFAGDIGKQCEAQMVRTWGRGRLKSRVLVAPHHGSVNSSSSGFVRAVAPEDTVISCGWMNRFGFPHPKVIQRLQAAHSRIWVTARRGAVQIIFDEKGTHLTSLR